LDKQKQISPFAWQADADCVLEFSKNAPKVGVAIRLGCLPMA
jgi:hypothetical protein